MPGDAPAATRSRFKTPGRLHRQVPGAFGAVAFHLALVPKRHSGSLMAVSTSADARSAVGSQDKRASVLLCRRWGTLELTAAQRRDQMRTPGADQRTATRPDRAGSDANPKLKICVGRKTNEEPVLRAPLTATSGAEPSASEPRSSPTAAGGACRLIAKERVEAVGRGDVGLALAKDQKQRPGRPLGWPLLSREGAIYLTQAEHHDRAIRALARGLASRPLPLPPRGLAVVRPAQGVRRPLTAVNLTQIDTPLHAKGEAGQRISRSRPRSESRGGESQCSEHG